MTRNSVYARVHTTIDRLSIALPAATKRIWSDATFRVCGLFFGIACFVVYFEYHKPFLPTSIFYVFVAVGFTLGLILVLSFVQVAKEAWSESVVYRLVELDELRKPTNAAKSFLREYADSTYAVDAAVVVFENPNLRPNFETSGWTLDQIDIFLNTALGYEVDERLKRNAISLRENHRIFSLIDVSEPFSDMKRVAFTVGETDRATVLSAKTNAEQDEALRKELGSLTPSRHRIPHTFSLHVLTAFSDQSILVLRKHADANYYPNCFSFSYEEQLNYADLKLHSSRVMDHWFRRSLCEEAFPLVGEFRADPEAAWRRLEKCVRSLRIWGLILEEEIGNFSLFGVCQLAINPQMYENLYDNLIKEGHRPDNEGALYFMSKQELRNAITTGRGRAISKIGKTCVDVELFDAVSNQRRFHPTSQYRGLRYLTALGEMESWQGHKP